MSFKLNLVRHLLGILTPEEISELTSESSGVEKISLSDVINYQMSGKGYEDLFIKPDSKLNKIENVESEAKILPFSSEGDEAKAQELETKIICGEKVIEVLKDFVLKCAELDKTALGARVRRERKRKTSRAESSLFILEQRKRIEKTIVKIKSREILELYALGSKQDIKKSQPLKDGEKEDEFSAFDQKGILLNKKVA